MSRKAKDKIILSQDEVDKILVLIKEGKSLSEIGKDLLPDEFIVVNKAVYESTIEEYNRLCEVVQNQTTQALKEVRKDTPTTVSLVVKQKVGEQTIELGYEEEIGNRTLIEAHQEAYLKLLTSLDNIISLAKD